jgi:hypothetical protein
MEFIEIFLGWEMGSRPPHPFKTPPPHPFKTLLNTPSISLAIQLGYKDSKFNIPPENPVSHY